MQQRLNEWRKGRPFTTLLGLLLLLAGLPASIAANDEGFCFISHGCWGGKPGHAPQLRVAKLMGQLAQRYRAKFVIAAGDNFYKHGVTSVGDSRFADTFEKVYDAPSLATIPFLTALGNHDYEGNVWAQVNYTQRSRRWHLPYPYYEKRFPEAFLSIVVIDTVALHRCVANRGKTKLWNDRCWDRETQFGWFRQTMRKARADGMLWIVVVAHFPVYANGPHENFQWLIDLVEPIMKEVGAQLYINADNHYLQVSHKDGIAYFNSGGGAGITPHHRKDKNYAVNRYNRFESMTMGLGVHCVYLQVAPKAVQDGAVVEEGSEREVAHPVLRTELFNPNGKRLYWFDVRSSTVQIDLDAGSSGGEPSVVGDPEAGREEKSKRPASGDDDDDAHVAHPTSVYVAAPTDYRIHGPDFSLLVLFCCATGFTVVQLVRVRRRRH